MLTKDDVTAFLREVQPICNLRGVKITTIELAPAGSASEVADSIDHAIKALNVQAVNAEAAKARGKA